jgi:hypothetical protein
LIKVAREHLPGLSYVVITEDRSEVAAHGERIGGRDISKEIAFAVTNRVLDGFRQVRPLSNSGWQRLMAANDERTFHRVVRAYYQVGN